MASFTVPSLRLLEWQERELHPSVTLLALTFHQSLFPLNLKLLVPLSHAGTSVFRVHTLPRPTRLTDYAVPSALWLSGDM
jgi:hypothetical protein